MTPRAFSTGAVLALLAGPALAGGEEQAIRDRLDGFATAFNRRDAAGACAVFAPDLRYAVPEVGEGTFATMCARLGTVLARPDFGGRYDPPDIHEILLSGEIAVVRLSWTLVTEFKGETDRMVEEGMDVFARQPDGRWSISRFIAFPVPPLQQARRPGGRTEP